MELSTITMERDKADQLFKEYRSAVKERHTQEDEQIMRGYRALAKGQELIRLSETIRAGGVKRQGSLVLPALAISRADREFVHLQIGGWQNNGSMTFAHEQWPASNAGHRVGVFRFQIERTGNWKDLGNYSYNMRAMVPNVPPSLRPVHHLRNYAILFEVDKWERHPEPPTDPALLKRVSGDLYAVLATWDLTELERAVLAGRGSRN